MQTAMYLYRRHQKNKYSVLFCHVHQLFSNIDVLGYIPRRKMCQIQINIVDIQNSKLSERKTYQVAHLHTRIFRKKSC